MANDFKEDMNDYLHKVAEHGKIIPDREFIEKVAGIVDNKYRYDLTSFLRLSKFVIDYLFRFPSAAFAPEIAYMIKLGYYMNQTREFKDSLAIVDIRRHFEAVDYKTHLLYSVDLIEFSSPFGYITILYANADENAGLDDIFTTRAIFGASNCRIDDIYSNVFDKNNKEIDIILHEYFNLRSRDINVVNNGNNIVSEQEDDVECLTRSKKLLLK